MKIRMDRPEYNRMFRLFHEEGGYIPIDSTYYLGSPEERGLGIKFLNIFNRMFKMENDYIGTVIEYEYEVVNEPVFMLMVLKLGLDIRVTEQTNENY